MRAARLALSLAAAAPIAATVAYAGWLRPWHLRWGATPGEAELDIPGDQQVPHPMLEATRAVTVHAPIETVWTWTVQRSYDLGRRHDERLDADGPGSPGPVPHLAVDDTLPTGPGDRFVVLAVDEPRSLALAFGDYSEAGMSLHGVLAVLLYPVEAGTRLVVRTRASFGGRLLSRLYALLFEPGDYLMVRRLLTSIRQRAEEESRRR